MTAEKKVWRAYLAGPEVFLPDPTAAAESLRAACARFDIVGVFPMDGAVVSIPGETAADHAARIRATNLDLIRKTDLVLANVSPFRGPSADDGTAYEMGFAAALGRPVFAYTDTPASLLDRTRAHFPLTQDATGDWRDPEGRMVEDFGLGANLMLVHPAPFPTAKPAPLGIYHGVDAALSAARDWISLQGR
ncbi:nucleoside 2-deoxyribosyltransferase [Nitrospirillum amazonense]|uniref:Nucleoside 2-deoxyribosyltransferase n=1 Tax=Nitrospirillum amazonense TaxID=28077 RepID=A0A560EUP1_9PROT|nr:nucleoside 2-deoxyribosyltransferase [Nitrospirillum amazonense]TWB12995.1 nucleoside 2-deoxyribosyltransferase [Nitrospirillum amazonense]